MTKNSRTDTTSTFFKEDGGEKVSVTSIPYAGSPTIQNRNTADSEDLKNMVEQMKDMTKAFNILSSMVGRLKEQSNTKKEHWFLQNLKSPNFFSTVVAFLATLVVYLWQNSTSKDIKIANLQKKLAKKEMQQEINRTMKESKNVA